MGIELLETGDKMRKAVIFIIRGCLRSVYNHPFIVGFVCFLILLYRSSPFIFSLLVSASPILICTAVLLGVLLSYGEPNIPEIEEEITFDSVSIKTGRLGDSTVVDQNGSYFVERLMIDDHLDDTAPLIEERSLEIGSNGGEIWEENGDLGDLGCGPDEKLKDEVIDSSDEKSEADSFGSETVNVDSIDSPPGSPWTRIVEGEDEEQAGEEDESLDSGSVRADEEDESLDSGSDRAESSSPDASMADIMPMIDELHPLLDDEPPQPIRTSHSGSEVASEKSLKSDGESENQDDNGEDDAQEEKEELRKSAIMWTEEDQKNLMDLGSSEIERNQRLENLVLRRRANKNMSIVPERNLIDLDSADYPFSSLAPVSTRRQNPFDSPRNDSDNNSGLPPIPGSAPSILLARRNPFDIPYDSGEEKPDLMGDGFKEEFATSVQSRDAVFRRYESFNVGPSNFGPNRKDVRMRPYFVPEGSTSEESSYSSSFQRQLSELSESKVSSVPETESSGSVEAFEGPLGDPHLISHLEEDVIREPELISEIEKVSELVGHGSQSSEDEYSVEAQIDDVADRDQLESVMEAEHVYRSDSSSSSLSEASERVFTEIESEGLQILEERRDDVNVLRQASTENSNPVFSGSLFVEVPHRAPTYNSSPRGLGMGVSSNIEILPDLSVTHPLSPEFSDPFVAIETTDFLFSTLKTIEEVDDIKEIDDDLLRLDNVGDFSVQQWGSGSSEFEKRVDSVEGNYKIKDLIDIHEEGVEYNISELQTSETSGAQQTLPEEENEARPIVSPDYGDNISEIPELGVQSKEDVDFVSGTEFNERDGLHSKTSENETLPEEGNEAPSVGSVVNIFEIPESKVHLDEDVDFVSKKDESSHGQADAETTTPQMPELEAGKIADIDQASKETIVDFEPTSVLEVGPIVKDDDATLDSKQSLSDSILSEETQKIFSGSNVAETNVPLDEAILPPNEQLKPNSDDELVAAEKSDHEVEAPKDHSTASVKGKGKSSSSSSSSSSDSSSSDSESD
ncbi:hypothetical protein CASFOL_019358 [Castilleja foliolosa]|uniref:Uncharacterized protein n=1 Tax=Castilleja foliolosa TaxID=1961234 RepID=A0ABD3D770_9LAMI